MLKMDLKMKTLSMATMLWVAGLGLAATAPAVQAADAAAPLAIGGQVRGEITTADRVNFRDGSRSKAYRFTPRSGDVMSFRVRGALKAELSLFADGELIDSSESEDGEEATLSFRAQRAVEHVLTVSGRDANAFGPFTLESKKLDLYSGQVLKVGSAVSDWADAPRSLQLQIDKAGLYAIDMGSDEFDALLKLDGNGLSISNDDGGDGSNARITARLNPGRYTLQATAFEDAIKGLYNVSVSEHALPEGVTLSEGGALPLDGSTINGLIQGDAQNYRLQVPSRQVVTLDMRSDAFDSRLILRGNGIERDDDDGGDGLNSRIVAVLEPGEYEVVARTAYDGGGLFTLSASARAVPEGAGGGPIVVGRGTSQATLFSGINNRHPVSIRSAGDYVIEMSADGMDSFLRLTRDGEEVASDDDSGGGLNARIETRLAPGEYVIEASSVDSSAEGSYSIGIRRR